MKRIILLFLVIFVCSGCSLMETNEKKIEEYNKCKDAGMGAFMGAYGDIRCVIPKQ